MSLDLTEAQESVRWMIEEMKWSGIYTVRNVAIALSLEASELLQELQWKSDEEIAQYIAQPGAANRLKGEMADVTINLIALSDLLGLDLNMETAAKCHLVASRLRAIRGFEKGMARTSLRCTHCSNEMRVGWQYCADCGTRIPKEVVENG